MKFPSGIVAAALTLNVAMATLDCSSISRVDVEISPVCEHFDGQNADYYYGWYNDRGIETDYTGMVYLQGSDPEHPENGAAVHWAIDGDYVKLAVAARATGWLAFGIGEAGGMLGADVAIYETANPDTIKDAYTRDERYPVVDDCDGNWELLHTQVDEDQGFMMVEFQRLLDTGDDQDREIINDSSTLLPPHRVIAAWGESANMGYHGVNVARGSIRFFGEADEQVTFDTVMNADADGYFFVGSEEHEIAAIDTEYAYNCFSRDRLISQGVNDTTDLLNVIGFEPIIQEGNEAYVHHYIIYGYQSTNCEDDYFPEVAYVWAPGDGPVTLPTNLGAPMFGEDGFQAFEIEVHYNNPAKTTGVIDNSGVRVFWTATPREHQIGILQVGDPIVALEGEAVGDGLTSHAFECPGTCSAIVGQEVTVLREYLHMHETGARIVNEQIRNGEVIRSGTIDYWEFDQNGNAAVQQDPFLIKPGDGFKTTCYFDGNDRKFGLGSSDEMCMAFLYYYPRQVIKIPQANIEIPWVCSYDLGFPPCTTDYEQMTLSTDDELGRIFGYMEEECPVVVTEKVTQAPTSSPTASQDEDGAGSFSLVIGAMGILCVLMTMF